AAARRFEAGERSAAALIAAVTEKLREVDAGIEYVVVVEPGSFNEVEISSPGCQILVAARIGTTRLIDNLRLGSDAAPSAGAFHTT
ncbi:MAG: pantoate--beta-alanine ligase, partial [Candidatus Dormibacteraeota bacterium]|nr:pantoate--beta-alanine ligase [Candidatus Dormibacteraeota bacterium]